MAETRGRDSGVTLIEMLVVLVLIAVSAGIVTLALPSGAAPREIAQEAGLLSSRLNLAAERSLIAAQPVRMEWRGDGYGFEVWTGDIWQTADSAALAAPHVLEDGIVLADRDGSRSGTLRITPDLLPGTEGVVTFRLSSGASQREVLFDGATARLMP